MSHPSVRRICRDERASGYNGTGLINVTSHMNCTREQKWHKGGSDRQFSLVTREDRPFVGEKSLKGWF